MQGLIGEKKANTLMSLLPPTGWGDVATKKDLELLESRVREQILRTALMINIPAMLAAVALSFAATRLG